MSDKYTVVTISPDFISGYLIFIAIIRVYACI